MEGSHTGQEVGFRRPISGGQEGEAVLGQGLQGQIGRGCGQHEGGGGAPDPESHSQAHTPPATPWASLGLSSLLQGERCP